MSKKAKTQYECQVCGHQSPKWNGKCLNCGSWDSYQKVVEIKQPDNKINAILGKAHEKNVPQYLDEIPATDHSRLDTKNEELNRVLGSGLVTGSLVLIGGQPGIGKSTLLLQMALQMKRKVLYISGEESNYQIKMRAERFPDYNDQCLLYNETDIHRIIQTTDEQKPELIIIDSIQTCRSSDLESLPGTVSQIRSCTQLLQEYAKRENIAILIIGHINKEGNIAGPMILEHIVDAVLVFEGDRKFQFRLLRAAKNRFGNTDEIGIFDMRSTGLHPISNPSELFLSNRNTDVSGQAIGTIQEGRRTVLSEVQVLINKAIYGTPQRSATGFDIKRLHMVLAVIENKLGIFFGQKDVYLNIAGGLKIQETSMDMSVVAAVLSAQDQIIIPSNFCFIGELSLSGEFSNVTHLEQRLNEAERMGFETILVPKLDKTAPSLEKSKLIMVQNVHQLSSILNHEI